MASMAQMRSGVHGDMMAQVTTTASSMTTPPMVGVPCFTRWRLGPSALTCWPIFSCFMRRMKKGMRTMTTIAARPAERNTW